MGDECKGWKYLGNLNRAIKRISAIDWSRIGEIERKSNVQLCKEYLRRTAIFFRTYPGKCVYPFISISNSITSPQVNIEGIELINEVKNSYQKAIVTSFLELNALIDEGNQIAIENKDLFEPVIKLYERGGYFYKRSGFVNVDGVSFQLNNGEEFEPSDISDKTLNSLDEFEWVET